MNKWPDSPDDYTMSLKMHKLLKTDSHGSDRKKGSWAIKCRLLSAAVSPDTIFHLACWCRLALFGNDRRVDQGCGTCADRCSTCCLQREHENVCYGPEPSAKPKSLPTERNYLI